MKKFILFLVLFFSITTPIFAATTLYQRVVSSPISSGVTLKNYIRFTDSGWQNINVLEVDLDDKYTNLGLLTSSNGVGTLQNVLTMANNADAIAGINADFFQAKSGKGNSVGLAIEDSEVVSSAYYGNLEKNEFATFALDKNNSVFADYFTNEIILTSVKTKESTSVGEINKFPRDFENIAIYTPAWGTHSHGSEEGLPLTEMVVENNKVVEIRYNEEAVEIPENGFVVSALGAGADFITQNFKVGGKVKLEVKFNIDVDHISLAVSGGAVLIKNGKIPENFDSNITGNNPRTAIASSKDESTIYLVTVDGRQKSSLGMTQSALAEFLKEIGAYNAINLDGGGSTTMVARQLGDTNLSVVNNPSGGALRNVINGVGVFNSAPASNKVAKLVIEVDDTNVFKGKERNVTVKAYNKYFNPVEIKQSDVKWSYDGVPITVNNGVLSGDTVGMTMLKAKVGNATAEIEINILSDPQDLSISPKKVTLSSGKSTSFTISAKNKNGYYGTLNNDEITWKIESFAIDGIMQEKIPSDASLKNASFTATTSGDYIISVASGNIKSYALITVSGKTKTIAYDFETQNYAFDPYPDEVGGDAVQSTDQAHSGKYSCKLSYDFKQDINIRAAYIEFKNNGIDIPENTTDIGFWLYNDAPKEDNIKIKLKDAKGIYHLIVVQKGITHTGWKEFTYSLANIPLPAKITDIYLAQDNINVQSEGYVYVDDLTFYQESTAVTTKTTLPKDVKGTDELQKYAELENDEAYRIAIVDEITSSNFMIEYMKNQKIAEVMNENAEVAIFTSQTNEALLKNIETEKILCNRYNKTVFNNATFITINSKNSGIRNTDSTQWTKVQEDIKSAKTDNIFIVMNNSLDNFSDNEEAKLWIDMLCDLRREVNKNIWVIHKGSYTDYSMERGIKYLGINNTSKLDDIPGNTNYILITVNGKILSYEIKSVFQ
ncbi:MAG: phosphodiester glycosidase family protein [Clostridia bacterium]|nr:phosphodiester glycosidase family protein [Clostridia bacterium]